MVMGIQEVTKHTPLSGPRVEGQHGGCVVTPNTRAHTLLPSESNQAEGVSAIPPPH